jgi:hypothetical protein
VIKNLKCVDVYGYLIIGFDAERLGLYECVCCAIYIYIVGFEGSNKQFVYLVTAIYMPFVTTTLLATFAKLQINLLSGSRSVFSVHTFSLPLFAPISIYILFSSTCTVL